jgi:Xaa-Pro aminopeptidase
MKSYLAPNEDPRGSTPEPNRPIIANVERLHEFMDHARLAAVAVRSGQNFTYLSGIAYRGVLARHLDLTDSPRGVLLLWPRRDAPVVILNKLIEPLTLRDSWVRRAEVYDAYQESPYRRLAEVIKAMGLHEERIGFEENYISAAHWKELQAFLPRVQMIDCMAMMNQVRWIKTPGELNLLKKAADLLDDAYLEVFSTIRPGDTEREVHGRIVASCIRRGADWAHGILNSGSNMIPFAGEGDTVFRAGDVVRTDYVAYVHGYPGHHSRNAVLGGPSAEQRRAYVAVRDIYRSTIDRCRPGVRAGDIFDYVIDEYHKHGWTYGPGGHVGHSVGPWWHQQDPMLTSGNATLLEEKMMLALEPHRKPWHIQDMIVVRRSGPELVSDKFPTDEPFVAG